VEFGAKIDIKCVDSFGEIVKGVKYTLKIASEEGIVGDDGMIVKDSTVPGETVIFEGFDTG
jgi:hypothetical protein